MYIGLEKEIENQIGKIFEGLAPKFGVDISIEEFIEGLKRSVFEQARDAPDAFAEHYINSHSPDELVILVEGELEVLEEVGG